MCLYSRFITNRKYIPNKKNRGIIPPFNDPRVLKVPIGCGNCIECKKQKARSWQIRLTEEIRTNTNGKFITLTFSNESIKNLINDHKELQNTKGYKLDNSIATKATRLFLERWRKHYKKSLRHWLITELGHNGTENIHLHGIIWTNEQYSTIAKHWQYGYIWPRPDKHHKTYVNEKTINYIIKYVTKLDIQHKYYKNIILSSPGIGNTFLNNPNTKRNQFNETKTIETYKTRNGNEIALPIYFRNKLYTDAQREKLWLQKLDKNERWICGEMVPSSNIKQYFKLLNWYRRINAELGYGDNTKEWDKELYENHLREIQYAKRTK